MFLLKIEYVQQVKIPQLLHQTNTREGGRALHAVNTSQYLTHGMCKQPININPPSAKYPYIYEFEAPLTQYNGYIFRFVLKRAFIQLTTCFI